MLDTIIYPQTPKYLSKSAFSVAGQRTNGNLEKLYKALLSLPPTSVEAERAFSATEPFITKLRSSLKDKNINAFSAPILC